MSRKELTNKKVVKAISLGLATALTMMTPMTALADTAQPQEAPELETPVENLEEASAEKQATTLENAETTIESAAEAVSKASTTAETAATEEQKELVTVVTPAGDETIAEGFEDISHALKNTVVEEGTDLSEEEKSVADKLSDAADKIDSALESQKDIAEDIVDFERDVDTKINDIADRVNDEGEADATKVAADKAEAIAQQAVNFANANDHTATYAAIEATEEALNEALDNQEKAEADLEQATADYESLASEYAELEQAYATLLLDETAAEEAVTSAKEKLEEKMKELKTAEEAIQYDIDALKEAKEYALQVAYAKMMSDANESEKFSKYTVKEGEAFGKENASQDYWKSSLEYFKLYMAYALDADESNFEWVKTKNNLDGTENESGFTGASYLKYTTTDDDGNEIVKYYNYHIADEKGNIQVYEKSFTVEEEIQAVEAMDEVWEWKNGDESRVITEDDIKVEVISEDPEASQVIWVKDAEDKEDKPILTNDSNNLFDQYKNSLVNNETVSSSATIDETTKETVYSSGEITVVDSWNKKKADEALGSVTVGGEVFDFKATKKTKNQINDYLAEHTDCVAEVYYNGRNIGDINNQSGWDSFWRDLGSATFGVIAGWFDSDAFQYDVKFIPLVDDYNSPKETHKATGIIETVTADVKTTVETTYSGSKKDKNILGNYDYSSRDAAIAAAKADAESKGIVLRDNEIVICDTTTGIFKWTTTTYGYSYNVTRKTESTEKKTISTQAYSATQYTYTKTQDAVEGVEYKAARNYWTSELADSSNDEKVKTAINNVLADLKTIEDKKTAAQIANNDVEAAYEAVKKAEEVVKALQNNGLSQALEKAKEKLDAAKENLDNAIELKQAIDADVERAQAAYELAASQTGKLFVPTSYEENPTEGGNENVIPGTPSQRPTNVLTPEQEALLAQYYAALEAQNQAAVLGANRNRVTTQKVTAAVAADEVEEAAPAEEKVEAPAKEVEEVAETPVDEYKNVVEIEDTKTALAGSLTEEEKAGMNWWWLLIVAALGATGVAMYRNSQKKKAAAQTTKSDK